MGPRVSTAPKTRASHWLALVALMVTTITGALSATAAVASPPPTLDAGFVTDDAGALSANELEAANTRLQELSEKSDADLFVVFVDAFTDPADATGWADTTANRNGLGPHQYLLAVAVTERNYYISAGVNGPISDAQLTDIEQKVQPLLAAEDWSGAVLLAADEIQGDGGAGMLRTLLVVLGIAVLAAVIWLIARTVRSPKARRGGAPTRRHARDPRPRRPLLDHDRRPGSR